jgi:hypothetical protein
MEFTAAVRIIGPGLVWSGLPKEAAAAGKEPACGAAIPAGGVSHRKLR